MIVCSDIGYRGRLGNQMFQVAAVIATAHRLGKGWDVSGWGYARYFPSLITRREGHGNILNIRGYFQDYRIFSGIENELRVMLTPEVGMTPDLSGKVGVHFRAYSNEGKSVEVVHPECDIEYYAKALSYFSDKAEVVVFSDDPVRAKNIVPLDGYYMEGNKDIVDLAIMSRCGGLVISNSSFAWWAAWLSRARVVIPQRWYGEGISRDANGLYPKNWIVV